MSGIWRYSGPTYQVMGRHSPGSRWILRLPVNGGDYIAEGRHTNGRAGLRGAGRGVW